MKNVLLVVLTIILAGAVGVGSYFITKNLDSNEPNNDITNNGQNNNSNIQEEVKVVDALDYTDGYYRMFKVKLPMITGNKPNSLKLNKTILDEVLPGTYFAPIAHSVSEGQNASKGFITDYEYIIKNNVIVIYVKASIPEGGSGIAASGNGLYDFSYFYDIANDKILTKLGDAAKLMELTDIDGAPNYDSLNDNFCSEITIEDGKIKVHYARPGQECL